MRLNQYRCLESPLLWWLVFGGSLGLHVLILSSTLPSLRWQAPSSQETVTPIEMVELAQEDSPAPSEAAVAPSPPTPASSPSSPQASVNPDFPATVIEDEGAIALPPPSEESTNADPTPPNPSPAVPEESPEATSPPEPLTPASATPPVADSPESLLPPLEESANRSDVTNPEDTLPTVTVPSDPTITSNGGTGMDLMQPDAALAVTIFDPEPIYLPVSEEDVPLDNVPLIPPELLQELIFDTSDPTVCRAEISQVLQLANQEELGKYVPLQVRVEPDGRISQVTYREDYVVGIAPPNEAYITLAECLVVNQFPPFEPARFEGEPVASDALIFFVSINPD